MKREKWEDDGRTVADMSGVSAPNLLHARTPEEKSQEPDETLRGPERRWAILGALRAALLIGAVFVAGLALVIFLLLQIWT